MSTQKRQSHLRDDQGLAQAPTPPATGQRGGLKRRQDIDPGRREGPAPDRTPTWWRRTPTSVNINTRESARRSSTPMDSVRERSSLTVCARISPTTPPVAASTRLSVMSWRIRLTAAGSDRQSNADLPLAAPRRGRAGGWRRCSRRSTSTNPTTPISTISGCATRDRIVFSAWLPPRSISTRRSEGLTRPTRVPLPPAISSASDCRNKMVSSVMGLRVGDPGFQPANGPEPCGSPALELIAPRRQTRLHRDRHPKVARHADPVAEESPRHHADDCETGHR